MPDTTHRNMVAPGAVHPAAYGPTAADPGAVGPNKFWIDSTSTPYQLKVRNAADTGWLLVGQGAGAPTFSGEVTGTDFKATGLTGATAGGRFGGATASGAPVSGTWAVGDVVVDRSGAGIWQCTVAGTPGTWKLLPSNVMTAFGDLIYGGSGGVQTRLAAGTAGYLLQTNGAGAPSWVPAPTGGGGGGSTGGGGSGALVPIQVINPLTAAQATMSFSSIPQTGFRNLRLVIVGRSTNASTTVEVLAQANGDGGANYDWQRVESNASTTTSTPSAADTSIHAGYVAGSSASAGSDGVLQIEIPNYVGTTFHKSVTCRSAVKWGTASGNLDHTTTGGFWRNTVAISSLLISLSAGNFDVGSYACLYGEMDTAGPLLTPASNLLYDSGPLAAAVATLNTGTLSQAYDDILVVISGASDTAATSTYWSLQFNGDSGANYDYHNQITANEGLGATSLQGTRVPGATAPANTFGPVSITIPQYAGATRHKTLYAGGGVKLANTAANLGAEHVGGWWRSTSPITSIAFSLVAGNWAVGTTIRVYGLPATAGGASVGTGTRLRISANQSITTATATPINWDTEDADADNQHYSSAANLTGTVSKTAASAALVGVGTLFTSELAVGQVFDVPGTAVETRVVIAIADDTHLTVNTAYANTAATQTATRRNSAVVFRQPGFWTLEAGIYSAALASGAVSLQYRLNGSTIIGQRDPPFVNASAGYDLVIQRPFQQWDYVELLWTQNSGGAVNVLADERTHLSVSARPTVIVAIPYVNIQDQKASNTAGGTFTSGAWRTRDLNTVHADTGGIATLAANQFTLPAGRYRCNISAPALQVDRHAIRLQNITDAATTLSGSAARAQAASNNWSRSEIRGIFTITGTKTFEVQHQCQTTFASAGLGDPAGAAFAVATEVYTVAEFWKEG